VVTDAPLAGTFPGAGAGVAQQSPPTVPVAGVPPGAPPPYITAPTPIVPPGGSPPQKRSNPAVVWGIVAAIVLVVAIVATGIVVSQRGGGASAHEDFVTTTTAAGSAGSTTPASVASTTVPSSSPSTTIDLSRFEGPSQTILPTRVAAPLQAAPGVDACGNTTTYVASNMFDSDPTTAWRTAGDGTGRRITLNLGTDTLLTQVGLINGMAKIDACDGTDRYFDQRRITSVEWTFDDGTSVTQHLDPSTKTLQNTDVNTVTTRVRLEIRATTPPGTRDFTPISEINLVGVPDQG
jgi:hypothetical protein